MVFSPQPHRGSPGLFAPDPRGGAIGTAALPSHSALIVNLGCQHASAVPHNHTPQRVHGSFPIIWRGPDNAVRDRQRKRNAVLPAFGIVAGSRVCNLTILPRYARICTIKGGCRRSGGLRGSRHCQPERRDYQRGLSAESGDRLTSISPSRCH